MEESADKCLVLIYVKNKMLKAIAMQHTATYGLFLSPILAHFQNIPSSPSLFLSSSLGVIALMYAHVQISSSTTVSKLWKLKMADIVTRNIFDNQ